MYCTCIYNIHTLSENIKFICTHSEPGQKCSPKDSLFYLFLKLVQINFTFFDNLGIIVYIYKMYNYSESDIRLLI